MKRLTNRDVLNMSWHARARWEATQAATQPETVGKRSTAGWPVWWDDSPDATARRREILALALEGFRCP